MSNPLVDCRSVIATAIATQRAGSGFVLNDFSSGESHLPIQDLSDLPPGGQLWVVALNGDRTELTRSGASEKEFQIEVAFQKLITGDPSSELTQLDQLVALVMQLEKCCMQTIINHDGGSSGPTYNFLRIEALKDQNGLPMTFLGAHASNIFEAYFVVHCQLFE